MAEGVTGPLETIGLFRSARKTNPAAPMGHRRSCNFKAGWLKRDDFRLSTTCPSPF